MKRHSQLWKWVGISAGLLCLLVVVVFFAPNPTPDDVIITIPKGASFSAVVDSLDEAGIILNKTSFKIVAYALGKIEMVRAGKYKFPAHASNSALFRYLQRGEHQIRLKVVLPEGIRLTTTITIISNVLDVDAKRLDSLARSEVFARSLGIDAPTLEGYLLPETYYFYWQPPEEYILAALVNKWKVMVPDSVLAESAKLGFTVHQLMTFASIVDAETSIPEEMPVIAGVYWNRLRRGMRLEADPTVQYGLPDGPRRLLYRDYKFDHPYNTYRIKGLPPGPIGNPGLDAIIASANPARHQFYFFVATGDGGHTFSRTFAEHQRSAREYRRVRNARQRMSQNL